ncbi:MAG: flagellar biosynthesis protein FlhF [Paucibacter sp.]|nr:flagellar biosynthesis protein FlhF [Roseateles sp.]
MNYRRFTARSSREALQLVKLAFGDDAVVLSNKRTPEGVEVLAMAPEGFAQIEQVASRAPRQPAPAYTPAPQFAAPPKSAAHKKSFAERVGLTHREPGFGAPELMADARAELRAGSRAEIGKDVQTLAMSTLSFQDYVRERVLKRRKAEIAGQPDPVLEASVATQPAPQPPVEGVASIAEVRRQRAEAALKAMQPRRQTLAEPAPLQQPQIQATPARRTPPVLRDEILVANPAAPVQRRAEPVLADAPQLPLAPELSHRGPREQEDMMRELRAMKGMIEERFGALAFMEKLQRQPVQARLTQRLLEVGFSPALVRKLVDGCPTDFGTGDESIWAANVLARNLSTDEGMPALEEQGGVFALIGSTGVGKTTSTAKLAAAFATRYGAGQLGLITLDAYRVGAHEQLRAYGRILGVPVHTAHDRSSLEDLLELLSGKKMILIDTAGMAQRDTRTAELLEMLKHPSIRRLLVVNAAQQGETIEDVVLSWRGAECQGVVLSKIDEAVKLAPALDAMIRNKLRIVGCANGQRVPEDWHRLSAQALVQRALKVNPGGAWRMDSADVNLVFAGTPVQDIASSVH